MHTRYVAKSLRNKHETLVVRAIWRAQSANQGLIVLRCVESNMSAYFILTQTIDDLEEFRQSYIPKVFPILTSDV